MRVQISSSCGIVLAGAIFACAFWCGLSNARAATIRFDPTGVFREDFGPPSGASGALLYRSTPAARTGPAISIPSTPLPATVRGTAINGPSSPITTKDGNPGTAAVVTYLSVGQGSLRVIQTGQSVFGPPGTLTYSFSASGSWEVLLAPPANGQKEVLTSVALDGAVAGDVRLNPSFLGTASASVSGTVNVGPFGSFSFTSGNQSGGGSFGISASLTGGGISFGVPPSGNTAGLNTFTGLSNAILPNTLYPFTLSGTLTTSLSGTGLTGTAYAIANLYTDEFNLTPNTILVPINAGGGGFAPVPEPSTLAMTGTATVFLSLLSWMRRSARRRRPDRSA